MKALTNKFDLTCLIVDIKECLKGYEINHYGVTKRGMICINVYTLPADLLEGLSKYPRPDIYRLNTLEGELNEIGIRIQLPSIDTIELAKAVEYCADLFINYGM